MKTARKQVRYETIKPFVSVFADRAAFSFSSEYRGAVARWITFLHSDQEYIWPEYSFIQTVNSPLNFLTFGWGEKRKTRKWEEFLEAGDFNPDFPFADLAGNELMWSNGNH